MCGIGITIRVSYSILCWGGGEFFWVVLTGAGKMAIGGGLVFFKLGLLRGGIAPPPPPPRDPRPKQLQILPLGTYNILIKTKLPVKAEQLISKTQSKKDV